MNEVPPCSVSKVTDFPTLPLSLPSSSSEDSSNTFGHISKDGTWAWIARGCVLEIFVTKSRERCGIWFFGSSSRTGTLNIIAVEELISSHLPFPCLLVGLDSPSDGGLICLFNIKTSKVISSIQLQYKITSLAVVSGSGGVTMETHPLSSQLRHFFGIVAVGTEEGNVLLLDLCLDVENYTDENKPNKAVIVNRQTHNLATKREQAISHFQHLCIFLNDNCFKLDVFEYKNNRTLIATFQRAEVSVTSLKYMRNLAVLAVGFNFGGMQLWNLRHLRLEFSIPNHPKLSIVKFAFQEPENDPRNFCYLWAIRGHYQGEEFRPEFATTAILYSLAYAEKEWVSRYGYLYHTLQSVTKRLEYTLSNDPYSSIPYRPNSFSRLISCEVISQLDLKLESEDSLQSEDYCCSENTNLCLISWENWSRDKPVSCSLVLFDLNQWYNAQMPATIRCPSNSLCSYLGAFSLNEITSKMDSIITIFPVPSTISRFKSSLMTEEMFYPSSVSFKIWCLSSQKMLQATYLGIQRQILHEMNITGPSILNDPRKVYEYSTTAGLLSTTTESMYLFNSPKDFVPKQREALLTLALENNMYGFLAACIQMWKNTEFLNMGCSTRFVLDWVWKTITKIKTSVDKLCLPLFNCSGQAFDESNLRTLHTYEGQLKHLSDILLTFQKLHIQKSESAEKELQLKKEAVDSIAIYLHIIIWLCNRKLLPEHEEGYEYGEDEVAYPISRFQKTYSYRRSELQKINSSIGLTDILLIDGIVHEFGPSLSSMWEKKGGNNVYPPPNIYAAVSSYLLDGPQLSLKHTLMFYLLLDMATFLADRQAHLVDKILSFCSSNTVPLSFCKLTQAFWRLDHCDFQTALTIFLDPVVSSADLSSSQHLRIIKSFLFQGHAQMALTYITTRNCTGKSSEQVKLHLSVLLANGLISDALNYQRKHLKDKNSEDFLRHIFLKCQQDASLHKIFQLPLQTAEHKLLAEHLLNCGDPHAPEILVLFNLLQGNVLEAANINEKQVSQMMERDLKSCERATVRNALVMGFVDALPGELKKLAHELNHVHPQIRRSRVNPQPLSTSITTKTMIYMSYADLLRKIMCKIDETSEVEIQGPSPFKSGRKTLEATPFLCSPFTPRQKPTKRKRPSDTVVSAGEVSTSEWSPESYTTPSKKIRTTETNINFSNAMRTDKTGISSSLTNEINSLLQTPPIKRVKPLAKTFAEVTPVHHVPAHSILKTSQKSLFQDVACGDRTPSVLSEIEEEVSDNVYITTTKDLDDQNLRQLRFQMPSPEASQDNYEFKYSSVGARKPIHDDTAETADTAQQNFDDQSKSVSESNQSQSNWTRQNISNLGKNSQIEKSSEDQFCLDISDVETEQEDEDTEESEIDVEVGSSEMAPEMETGQEFVKEYEIESVTENPPEGPDTPKEHDSIESMDYTSANTSIDSTGEKIDPSVSKSVAVSSTSLFTYTTTPTKVKSILVDRDFLKDNLVNLPDSSSSCENSNLSQTNQQHQDYPTVEENPAISSYFSKFSEMNPSLPVGRSPLLRTAISSDQFSKPKIDTSAISQLNFPAIELKQHSEIRLTPSSYADIPKYYTSTYVSWETAATTQSTSFSSDISTAITSSQDDTNRDFVLNISSSQVESPYTGSLTNILLSEQRSEISSLRNLFATKQSEVYEPKTPDLEVQQTNTTNKEMVIVEKEIAEDVTAADSVILQRESASVDVSKDACDDSESKTAVLDKSPVEISSVDSLTVTLPPEKPSESFNLRNIFASKAPETSYFKTQENSGEAKTTFFRESTVVSEILTENLSLMEDITVKVGENIGIDEDINDSKSDNLSNNSAQEKGVIKDPMAIQDIISGNVEYKECKTSDSLAIGDINAIHQANISSEAESKEEYTPEVEFHDASQVFGKDYGDGFYLRTQSRSKSPFRSKTPTLPSEKKESELPTMELKSATSKDDLSSKQDTSLQPEVKDYSDSLYPRTRARSKSKSPSRSKTPTLPSKEKGGKLLADVFKVVTSEEFSSERDTSEPMEEDRSDDHLYPRTRLRSKSRSPARSKTPLPVTIPEAKHLIEQEKSVQPMDKGNFEHSLHPKKRLRSESRSPSRSKTPVLLVTTAMEEKSTKQDSSFESGKSADSPYLGTRSKSNSNSPVKPKTPPFPVERKSAVKLIDEKYESHSPEEKPAPISNIYGESKGTIGVSDSPYLGTRAKSRSPARLLSEKSVAVKHLEEDLNLDRPSKTSKKRYKSSLTKEFDVKNEDILSSTIISSKDSQNVMSDILQKPSSNEPAIRTSPRLNRTAASRVALLAEKDIPTLELKVDTKTDAKLKILESSRRKNPARGKVADNIKTVESPHKVSRRKNVSNLRKHADVDSFEFDVKNENIMSSTLISAPSKEFQNLTSDFPEELSLNKSTKRTSPRSKRETRLKVLRTNEKLLKEDKDRSKKDFGGDSEHLIKEDVKTGETDLREKDEISSNKKDSERSKIDSRKKSLKEGKVDSSRKSMKVTKSIRKKATPISKKKTSVKVKEKIKTSPKTQAKDASQVAQKLEFNFSPPASTGNINKIIETVAQSPPTPVARFEFSPPATRLRVKKKLLNESLNITVSDSPMGRESTPSQLTESKEFAKPVTTKGHSASQTKTTAKKNIKSMEIQTPKADINLISPFVSSDEAIVKSRISTRLSVADHSINRKKTKGKTAKLYN